MLKLYLAVAIAALKASKTKPSNQSYCVLNKTALLAGVYNTPR